MDLERRVAAHYGREDLVTSILDALARGGTDTALLRTRDLEPIDEFHIGGAQATAELARRLDLADHHRVLDVGSGLGGPSRHIAERYGCRVEGLDLTEAYCECAEELARRTGLDQAVRYRQGSALAMPFSDGSFDRAITQHVAMNIADKATFYEELRRVLRPRGLLGIYDVLAGPGGDIHFPVPWARDASESFLASPEEMETLLDDAGFEIIAWRDRSEDGLQWFQRLRERMAQDGPPAIGFSLLLGDGFRDMAANQVRNLAERRILPTEIVARAKARLS